MVIVTLSGMDIYEAIDETKRLHAPLIALYGLKENELEFYAPEGFIIHNGIEQTAFRLNITVEAPIDKKDKEADAVKILTTALKNVAIHFRVLFRYFDPANEHLVLDATYPEYMDESNTVKAESQKQFEEEQKNEKAFEEESEEPYMGEIIPEFDKYIKEHPDATSDEVYAALAGIRKDVTAKHHEK
jgi:hypothetical protein